MPAPVVLVNFSVTPEAEVEFNRFYHRSFLPALLSQTPEIVRIRRYEEYGAGGTLRFYKKQFLTIYELADEAALRNANAIFERSEIKSVISEFRRWKDKALTSFSRLNCSPTWTSPRQSEGGLFCRRPFFLWQLEMGAERDREFQNWYEKEYLPVQISEIPLWSGVARYESIDTAPVRHFTIFESDTLDSLKHCIESLRTPLRLDENVAWQKRVEALVSWQDAASFMPIYSLPD